MNTLSQRVVQGFIVACLVTLAALVVQPFTKVEGAAFTGMSASLKFATTSNVGPQGNLGSAITIFPINGECKSRVISTLGGTAIMVSFGDPRAGSVGSTTLQGAIGHWQAASTTVVYDSGLYGCGRWTAYAYSSTTLTVTEF